MVTAFVTHTPFGAVTTSSARGVAAVHTSAGRRAVAAAGARRIPGTPAGDGFGGSRSSPMTMETLVWAPVGPASAVSPGATPFEVVGLALTLVATDDGELFCVTGKTPPTGLPLTGAVVDAEARTVQCPQYGTRWSLETGEVVGAWIPSPPIVSSILRRVFSEPTAIPTYPVRVNDANFVEVLVDADAKADFESSYWSGLLDAKGKASGGYY